MRQRDLKDALNGANKRLAKAEELLNDVVCMCMLVECFGDPIESGKALLLREKIEDFSHEGIDGRKK